MFASENLPKKRFQKAFEQEFTQRFERGDLSRREILAMLSAAGAGVVLSRARALAQSMDSVPRIIDTHHHIYPPKFVAANLTHMQASAPLTGTPVTNWTPRYSLDQMDQTSGKPASRSEFSVSSRLSRSY